MASVKGPATKGKKAKKAKKTRAQLLAETELKIAREKTKEALARLEEEEIREEERLREEARKVAPAICDHCHETMPVWFLTPKMKGATLDSGLFNDSPMGRAVYRYCFHCERGFPYPEPGETKAAYEVRLDAWEPDKDPPAPAGGSDV
jgi:hypothetical protein